MQHSQASTISLNPSAPIAPISGLATPTPTPTPATNLSAHVASSLLSSAALKSTTGAGGGVGTGEDTSGGAAAREQVTSSFLHVKIGEPLIPPFQVMILGVLWTDKCEVIQKEHMYFI